MNEYDKLKKREKLSDREKVKTFFSGLEALKEVEYNKKLVSSPGQNSPFNSFLRLKYVSYAACALVLFVITGYLLGNLISSYRIKNQYALLVARELSDDMLFSENSELFLTGLDEPDLSANEIEEETLSYDDLLLDELTPYDEIEPIDLDFSD